MKKLLIAVILLTGCASIFISNAFAQSKLIRKLLLNEKDSTRSASFLALPAIGYSPVTGFEFGVSGLYSFYSERTDTLTRNSVIGGLATLTTKKQSNFLFKGDVWTPQNRYHYLAEVRYRDFPFDFYGVGSRTFQSDKDTIDLALLRISGEVEKLIRKRYYAGLNLNFENHKFNDNGAKGIYANNPFINDKDGGKVLFLGISQILDTRNTNTYTTKGTYIKIQYAYAPDFFGGENFSGSLSKADFRTFNNLSRKSILGIHLVYQSLQGERSPFYLLPQLGNDNIMRGYYTGRYRNENLLAAQAEWRYRFIARLGIAAFAGAGNAYNTGLLQLSDFKPSYGGGLRYFFDIERSRSLRLDYGIGEKRPGEKRQTGFYISFGEAF